MAIKDMQSGGNFFKPEDYKDAVALLVEVVDLARQVPSGFGPKDTAYADITIFGDSDELNAGSPSTVLKRTSIQQTVLARDLFDQIGVGNATIVSLAQVPPKKGNNPAWVWRTVGRDVKAKVADYAEKRDAAIEAALADAPDFD